MMTVADFQPGDRVQLAPHLDLWMRGARYGVVTSIGRNRVRVALDAIPGAAGSFTFYPEDLYHIDS